MADEPAARPLSSGRLVAFSAISVSLAASSFPLMVYLPAHYAQEFGLSLAAVGLIFTLARIWNSVNDPLIGLLSDRAGGRRKPWIVAGGLLYLATTLALFFPPADAGALWLGLSLFFFYIGTTLVLIPHYAWSGELSARYHERSRVQTYLQTASAAGLFLILLLPALIDWRGGSQGDKVGAMGLFMIATLCPALLLLLRFPEAPAGAAGARPGLRALAGILFSDAALARVIASDLLVTLGQGMRGALFLFFVTSYVGLPHWASTLWLVQFLFGIAAAPIWLRISYRLGKARTLVAAELSQAAINLGLLLVAPLGWWTLAALTVAQGLTQGSGNLMLRSVIADIADSQRLATGENRSGLLFSLFSFTGNLGMALAAAIAPTVGIGGLRARRRQFAIGPAGAALAVRAGAGAVPCVVGAVDPGLSIGRAAPRRGAPTAGAMGARVRHRWLHAGAPLIRASQSGAPDWRIGAMAAPPRATDSGSGGAPSFDQECMA